MSYKILLGVLLISNSVFSQTLNRSEYIKKAVPISNTQLKMVILDDNNKLESTEKVNIDQIQIPEKKRFNIQYDTKINKVKESQVPPKLAASLQTKQQWKIVPEILSSKEKGTENMIDYQIYFTSVKPFKYNQESKVFDGQLGFVLVDIVDGNIIKNLDEPAYIEVNSDEIDQIKPEKLSVNHLSLPSSEIVLSEKNGLDSLKLKIITKNNLAGYDTYIKVEPALNIILEEKNMMSFGVEKALINVRMIGSSNVDSVKISFTSESGRFNPQDLILKNNEVKTVQMQSGYKLGNVQIKAIGKGIKSGDYESNSISVNYTFPWLFIIFSITGGVLGGIVRYRKKIKLKKILLSMTDGFAACIIYFILKIPIPQLGDLDNFGAVVFGVGLLGGFATITGIFPYIKSLTQNNTKNEQVQDS